MSKHRNLAPTMARLLARSSLAVVILAGLAVPAQAQNRTPDEAEDSAAGLEEIIVQARRVSENLQDVPVAVTAFSGDDIVRQSLLRVQELGRFTPGLQIRPGATTPSAITITLRGQVQTDILATLDPSVGTYVDGVYWARSYGLNTDFLDLQSVQILKGPQGTLFGRNTTGGALLFTSNDPDLDTFSGRASFTYGRFDEMQGTAILNAPIVSGKLGVRLAVQRSRRDGYTTNVVPANATTGVPANAFVERRFTGSRNGVKLDNRDRWNARGKIEWHPTDNLSIQFAGGYSDQDEQTPSRILRLALPSYSATTGAANIAPAGAPCTPGAATNSCPNTTFRVSNTAAMFAGIQQGNPPATAGAPGLAFLNAEAAFLDANPDIVSNNEIGYSAARTYTYTGTTSLDTFFGNIKLIAAYRKVRAFSLLDLEGSSLPIHVTEGSQNLKQKSVELQITGKAFGDALDFATGAFAFHEDGFDKSLAISVPALNANTDHAFAIIDNDSIGVYAQATWHITDTVNFTGGLRYSIDDKRIDSRNNNLNRTTGLTTCALFASGALALGGQPGPIQCSVLKQDDFGGWSYTAGLDYQPTADLLFYIKTSKGFRSGGQNLRAPSSAALIAFRPETAYAYEIGAKLEFLDRRLRINAAAYQTNVTDIQRSALVSVPPVPPATVPGVATILTNAGKSRFRGFELEVAAALFDGFRVAGTLAHVDPKYISFADVNGDRRFENFADVAPWQYSLSADYDRPVGSVRVKAGVNYSWQAATPRTPYNFPANPSNDAIQKAATLEPNGLLGARASLGFADDMFEVAVFGRNLTNVRTFNSVLALAQLGYVAAQRQEPRTYGVTGTFRF